MIFQIRSFSKTTALCTVLMLFVSLSSSGCMIVRFLRGTGEPQGLRVVKSPIVQHPVIHPETVRTELAGAEDGSDVGMSSLEIEKGNRYKVHDGVINSIVVSEDGTIAFTGGEDGKVIQSSLLSWVYGEDTKSVKERAVAARSEILLEGERPVNGLALSPDERYLAISQFSVVTIFDLQSRTIIRQLTQVKGRISSLAWDPRNQLILLGLSNGDIFGWSFPHGPTYAVDSADYVEEYSGAESPIVGLEFHPTGRAFFSVERDGGVNLWRLLRTEKEMGLRDDFAIEDQELTGKTHKSFSGSGARNLDMWVTDAGDYLYVSAVEGKILRWKVRGQVQEGEIRSNGGAIASFVGLSQPLGAGQASAKSARKSSKNAQAYAAEKSTILVALARDQRVKVWCQKPDLSADSSGLPGKLPPTPPIAESGILKEPMTFIRAAKRAPILWATEKTGNLLSLDLREIIRDFGSLQRCR